MKIATKLAAATFLTCLIASPVMATDYSSMSTEELATHRGTMQQASQEERSAFQNEWKTRTQRMSTEERQQYQGRPDSAPQDGSGQQYRRENKGQYAQQSSYGNMSRGGRGGGRGGRR